MATMANTDPVMTFVCQHRMAPPDKVHRSGRTWKVINNKDQPRMLMDGPTKAVIPLKVQAVDTSASAL